MKNLNFYNQFASFYDKIYRVSFYQSYANFIREIIKECRIKKPIYILDIACGTGRLIREISSERGIKIEGIDISKEMLKIAKKRNKKVKFYHQDLINFRTGKRYNIILCTFDSINYITKKNDLRKVFKNVTNHLKKEGIFVFDFNTIYKKPRQILNKGEVIYRSTIKKRYWNITIEMKKENNIYKEQHQQRFYSFREIKNNIARNNLKIVTIYSDFNNKIFSTDKHQRLFVVAQKQ